MKVKAWRVGKYNRMRMLSVLIVDDEAITRKGLKSHINWEKLKIDEIYDSGNAIETLEMVRRYKPDLILSDVSMPGMNGIELCKEIREINSECQIIFLSGYSDKEYLKGAIAVGAVDYVEKPIDIDEVEGVLALAVEKQLESKRKKEKIRRLVTENNSLTAKKLLEKITLPNANIEALELDFAKLKLDWSSMHEFVVLLFRICPQGNHVSEALIGKIKQELGDTSYIYSMKDSYHLVFVCAFPKQEAVELARKLQNRMVKQTKPLYYCAIGEPVSLMEMIYESYQSAVVKMQQMYFWNKTRFLSGKGKQEQSLNFDETIFAEFTKGLKQYKEEISINAIKRLYSFMLQCEGVMVSSVKGIYFRFIEALFQKAEFSVGNASASDAEIVGMIWEKLHGLDELEMCQRYLSEETENYFKNVEELAGNNQTIIMVISYIQSNYQDAELCLENIAENVYLSQNYLSSLFKKKMGKTISQYIVEIRVSHAKVFLCDRSLKLYDVALRIGYKDANYFAKIFKKAVGITPSEYREKYKK